MVDLNHPARSQGKAGTDMDIHQLAINTLRMLAVDAVEAAGSGHAGTPLGAAAIAYVLWTRFLKHNPKDPLWPDRDRFILSCGHASMLLYGLLYLSGYDLTLDDLKRYRSYDSRTPGHPELGLTPGVEMTTGVLGQGFSHAVGACLAQQMLAARYNRPGHIIVDHHVYVLASDGDMQEGVSGEAASLAGTLGLSKLICLYDSNGMQIDSPTEETFTENVALRFQAYGWRVIGPIDGHAPQQVANALEQALDEGERPCLIICNTRIGIGSPRENTNLAHHGPLGPEGVLQTRKTLGWPYTEPFFVPEEVLAHMRSAIPRGEAAQREWEERMARYRSAYPDAAKDLEAALSGTLPSGWNNGLDDLFNHGQAALPPRKASSIVLNSLATKVTNLVGGSADLAGSTMSEMADAGFVRRSDFKGRNLRFGVREQAMSAIAGGIALHGGLIPYTATYLVFSDFMRPSMRLAAMMNLHVIYLFTHDSVGVGEDGPTHQPVEHLIGLRAIPNLVVIRPADSLEVAQAWQVALSRRGPTALVLARQATPPLERRASANGDGVHNGAYILWQHSEGQPDLILIGSGSETHIALRAGQRLAEDGINIRVISMPSWELFSLQPDSYRHDLLPPNVQARVSIEAGSTLGWERYVGMEGLSLGVDNFGLSGPGSKIYEEFGLTVEHVVSAVKERFLS